MSLRRNLIISLTVSIALHSLVVLCIAGLVMVGASKMVSVFKPGSSYVMVTLEEPSQPEVSKAVLSEMKKNVPKPVVVKKDIQAPVIARKIEQPVLPKEVPVKIAVPKMEPVQPAVVAKKENILPPVINKPDEDEIISEADHDAELEASFEDMFHDKVAEKTTEPAIEKNSGVLKEDDGSNKGMPSFASEESFVDVRPAYPLGARLRGEEGVVVVRVTVSPSGRAEKIEVMKSSGFASLDGSAVDALKKARFIAKNGGTINGGEVTLPFRFKLVD